MIAVFKYLRGFYVGENKQTLFTIALGAELEKWIQNPVHNEEGEYNKTV